MAWWNDEWNYRLRVKVNSDYVDSNLTDVPLWVRLRDGNFDFTKTTTSGGEEIRFVDYNNTQIPYEITQWNTASGIGDIWVKFSEVSSTEDSYVWMYYGNPTASGVADYYFDDSLVEDEFPGTTLSGIWTWVAGTGGSYTVSGTQLHMTMGTGDVYAGTYTPTWAYQSIAANEDFFVETKVTVTPSANSQQAGIHFAKASDANGYNVRFGLVWVSAWGGRHVWRDDEVGGANNDSHTAHAGTSIYLRMTRIGRTIRTWWSDTGVDGSWTEIAPANRVHVNEAAQVGLFAFSGGGPVITADFDYFHFVSMPAYTKVWEDYDLVYHLNEETLDGTTDQVKDSSPVLNHGTSTGHPTPGQAGVVNTSTYHDGSDYITTAVYAGVAGSNDRTTMLWFKPTVADQGQWAGMFTYGASSTNAGWFMESATNNEDYYAFLLYGAAADTPTWIAVDPSEGWNHWALSWDSTDWKGFYNGNIITNRSASPNTTASTYLIGRNWDIPTNCIGYLDEVRVAIKAIDDDEIKVQYLNMGEHSKIMSYDEPDYEGLYPQWLGTWDQRIKLTIDHTKIDEPLEDFPTLVTLASGVGLNGADVTAVFDELDYAFEPNDTFSGTNGDPPDPTKWLIGASVGASAEINDNKFRMSVGSGATRSAYAYSRYHLMGDFDVQVDFDIVASSNTNHWWASLAIHTTEPDWTNKHRAIFYREYNSNNLFNFQSYDGSYHAEDSALDSNTSGKMRVTRVGSVWTCYYDTGAGWQTLGPAAFINKTGPVHIRLRIENGTGNPALTWDWDNFQVNVGTVIWGNEENYVSSFPNRKKIAITTWNGTQECYAEIDRWEQHNEQALLWTKVPYISDVEDTILYLYYDSSQSDNDTYIGDRGENAAQNVWDNGFQYVLHLNQQPTTAPKDSARGNTNGTLTNLEDTDFVDTFLGKGLRFDGVDEHVALPDKQYNYITVETIAKFTAADPGGGYQWEPMVSKDAASPNRNYSLISNWSSGNLIATWATSVDGSAVDQRGYVNNDMYNTWRHYAGTLDGTKSILFVDGINRSENALIGTMFNNSADITIAARPTFSTNWWKGDIAEVRISNVARSEAWLAATYNTCWDNFISYSSPENTEVFRFQGTVTVEGTPAARTVYLYRRDTGEFVREVTSNEIDGLFEAGSPHWDYHFFVILPELAETYDLIAHDKIHPGN